MRTASLSALALAATAAAAAAQEAPVPPGQQTFQVVCATCHSINPPANKAPPMAHVMGYYRRAFKTEDEAVEAIVQWVQRPEHAATHRPPR